MSEDHVWCFRLMAEPRDSLSSVQLFSLQIAKEYYWLVSMEIHMFTSIAIFFTHPQVNHKKNTFRCLTWCHCGKMKELNKQKRRRVQHYEKKYFTTDEMFFVYLINCQILCNPSKQSKNSCAKPVPCKCITRGASFCLSFTLQAGAKRWFHSTYLT